MIGIDTNVLLRYVLPDDPAQSEAARSLIDDTCSEQSPALVNPVVLCELWWTLERRRKVSKEDLVAMLFDLLANPNIVVHDLDTVVAAISAYAEGQADFPDYLILFDNRRLGARETMTFDRGAGRPPFMTRLT